jgi:hypothetical protein
MRIQRLITALAVGCFAATVAARADAALIMIPQPSPAYTSSTSLIDISGLTDGNVYSSIFGSGFTVTFGTPMMRLTVPDTWNTWNTPPFTETDTPPVLWSIDASAVRMTLSSSQLVFGFEAQPDLSAIETLIATFFDDVGNPLGSIARDVSGNGGALLFAVASDIPIGSVLLTDAQGNDFAIANVRFSSRPFVPISAPATDMLVAIGLALLLLWQLRPWRRHDGLKDAQLREIGH